jgi:hypothetical protein
MSSRTPKTKVGRRYQTPATQESDFQPGSHRRVLQNLKGIKQKSEMDRAEYDALVRVQSAYLERTEQDTRFTAALIRQMQQGLARGALSVGRQLPHGRTLQGWVLMASRLSDR